MNNRSFDSFLEDGCGRCDKYQTPDCKVLSWTEPLVALREILNDTVLDEEMKWGSPCYTLDGKNVLLVAARADHCSVGFMKGFALDDPDELLEAPGPNSRYARLMKFRSVDDVYAHRESLVGFLHQAIELHRSGVDVQPDSEFEPMPAELEQRLASDPELQAAFDALTPGRQRSYNLYVGGAKKSETREARVERSIPKIYAGKGYNER